MTKKELTKYSETRIDNRLANFGLRGLDAVEQDLWWALARKIKDRGTGTLTFSRKELEALSGYGHKHRSKKTFVKKMKTMGAKIVSLNTEIYEEDSETWILFSLFPIYKVNERGVTIKVSEYFAPWFNNLEANYSRVDLSILTSFRSGYTKELYRFLMRWRSTGVWTVSDEKLRRLMAIPESYRAKDIERRIFDVAKKEFLTTREDNWAPFEYLDIKRVKGTKGDPERWTFTFKVNTLTPKLKSELARLENASPTNLQEMDRPIRDVSPKPSLSTSLSTDKTQAGAFVNWIMRNGLSTFGEEYFDIRGSALDDIKGLYKKKVQDGNSKAWTDMRFLACVIYIISEDKSMTVWNLEDAYYLIKKGKTYVDIPKKLLDSLPENNRTELLIFAKDGEVI